MVILSQSHAGVIEVDFSGEAGFDVSTHGLDITFGLDTQSIGSTSILINDGGDPASVLQYLVEAIEAAGFKTDMEPALLASLKAMQQEARQLQQIRSGKITPI